MQERNLTLFVCPKTGQGFRGAEIVERRTVNGVDHVLTGTVRLGERQYQIADGILMLGAHDNRAVYDRMWADGVKNIQAGVENRGVRLQERLLTRLGCKSLGWVQSKRFVDIGCGLGRFSYAAANLGADVIGVDSSSFALKEAFRWSSDTLSSEEFARCDFVQSDIMDAIFNPRSFDVVFCAHVIHHLKDTRAGLKHISKYVNRGGHLAVTFYDGEHYKFPPLVWILREAFMELPDDLRFRALRKLGILDADPSEQIADVKGLLKKCMMDPELAKVFEHLGLNIAIHHEHLSTPFTWVQTPHEVEAWLRELGFAIEFNRACTVVGRLGEPTIGERIRSFLRRRLFAGVEPVNY